MSALSRPARREEVDRVAPVVVGARLAEDRADLLALWTAAPWRLRVTDRGETSLLGVWHEGMSLCAVFGLWCAPSRVAPLVRDLCDVARDQSFERLLGPMVPESIVRPYLDAGLHRMARVLVLRLERPRRVKAPRSSLAGVTLRLATPGDMGALLAVDEASFESLWRCDGPTLRRYAQRGRLVVASKEGSAVGYTLATIHGSEGSLGRLAVVPEERGRGIGRALVADAVGWLAAGGARAVTLSTQDENVVARRLYGSLGFREQPEALAMTVSDPLQIPSEE